MSKPFRSTRRHGWPISSSPGTTEIPPTAPSSPPQYRSLPRLPSTTQNRYIHSYTVCTRCRTFTPRRPHTLRTVPRRPTRISSAKPNTVSLVTPAPRSASPSPSPHGTVDLSSAALQLDELGPSIDEVLAGCGRTGLRTAQGAHRLRRALIRETFRPLTVSYPALRAPTGA